MPLTVSHSSVKSFRRCKRQYYYKIVEELEPRLPSHALKLGSWFHKLMEAHYTTGNWKQEHAKLIKEWNKLFVEEREMYGDMPSQAERLMGAYVHHYGKEEKDWEILYVEETFELPFAEGDILTFKPDLIIRDHSTPEPKIWVMDHKTAKDIPSGEWRLTDLQSTIYPWALRELGLDVDGFIFNYVRKKAPTVPKINKDGSISRRRIDTDYYTMAKFLLEYYETDSVKDLPSKWKTQLRTLKASQNYFRRSRIIKDEKISTRQFAEFVFTVQEIETWTEMAQENPDLDPWVRTMEMSCEWQCDFRDLCTVELLGGDGAFIRKSKYQASQYTKERNLGN